MMDASAIRTVLVCGGLSLFGLLALNLDNYFPNNAYEAMQSFLRTRIHIKGHSRKSSVVDALIWSVFATLPLMSLIPACIITPYLTDFLGRKASILIFLFAVIPGRLFQAVSIYPHLWPLLFIGRFLSSFGGNAFMVVLPVLITEVTHEGGKLRSVIGSLQTVSFVAGAFLGIVLGLEDLFGTPHRWPWAYQFILVFGILGIPVAIYMKETPQFLAAKGKSREKVAESLVFYRGDASDMKEILDDTQFMTETEITENIYLSQSHLNKGHSEGTDDPVHSDHEMIPEDVTPAPESDESMIAALFFDPELRLDTLVSIFVSISYYPIYQLNFFSTMFFIHAGYPNAVATYCTMALKGTALLVTILCFFTIDTRENRRIW